MPSNFDVTYAYNLGYGAAALIAGGFTGYITVINNLKLPVEDWKVSGVPITALLRVASANAKPSVPTATVDLNGPAYRLLCDILSKGASATVSNIL
jgi:pyrophosphate--fructose-6-phosphate 1-phosphotransferase